MQAACVIAEYLAEEVIVIKLRINETFKKDNNCMYLVF